MSGNQIESFVLLTFLSLSYSTSLRRVEKLRRAVTLDRVPDMLGVWTFAAALTLPPPLIVAFVITANLGEWPSRKAVQRGRPAKYAVSTGATAAWCVAAGQVACQVPGVFGIVSAIATFCALSVGFVAVVVCLSGHRRILGPMMSDPRTHLIEVTTQSFGAAVGVAMMVWHPAVGVGALPCLFGVHIAALRHSIRETSSFDADTGLWSETAWRAQAIDLLSHGYYVIVIVADATSSSPHVVAEVIRGCLRPTDPIGRYGHEQVVAVSVVGAYAGGMAVANRVRNSLSRAGAGCAHGSRTARGEDLSEMLMLAGSDLMAERARSGWSARGRG